MGRYNDNWKRAYSKLAEEFFELQAEYDELNTELENAKNDLALYETAVARVGVVESVEKCGHSFIADTHGNMEIVGKYIVNVTKDNTNGS